MTMTMLPDQALQRTAACRQESVGQSVASPSLTAIWPLKSIGAPRNLEDSLSVKVATIETC